MRKFVSMFLVLALALCVGLPIPKVVRAQQQQQFTATQLGQFYAPLYGTWRANIVTGNTTTGSGVSITVNAPSPLSNGTQMPIQAAFSPIFLTPILVGDANQETVTPTSISIGACPLGGSTQCATITGTFNNTHGASNTQLVQDGTFGLGSAETAAFIGGGGTVDVDNVWANQGGTNAMISALLVVPTVSVADYRAGMIKFWNPTPTGAALAVPTTLTAQAACDATHQFCSDATVAGSASYAGGSLFGCVAYVDIMGNEGPCSLTASFTDVSAKAIDVAAPAASAGAVGYVVYLSLDAGTYAQAYQIPSTATNCTLTTLETITPACAVANTTYGQSVSTFGAAGLFTKGGSQITTIALNTGQHFTTLGSVAMTATSLSPISNSSVSYAYTPSTVRFPGISTANVIKYAASGSSATTIPNAIATWTIPANAFNFIGAEFRVSGKFTFTDGGDSSTKVLVAWDSPLSNATTVPTTLCSIVDTATGTGAAYNGTYYCSVKVATTGATGTALVDGYANLKLAAGATTLVRDSTDVAVAPSAATVNWTAPSRVVVYFIGTGATNNPGAQGLAAKLEILN